MSEFNTHDDHNPNHPDNREELEKEIFDTNSLELCLDYFKLTGDSEPLENAIAHNELVKQMVKEDLTETIKLLRSNRLDATANFLCISREKLK